MYLNRALKESYYGTKQAKNTEELLQAYADWAQTYDADSIGRFGYTAPTAAACTLARHLRANNAGDIDDVPILDAGAGTGQVGARLGSLGFKQIIAVDLSAEMLAEADAKACYAQLICGDLHDSTLLPVKSLGGLVCVGTLLLPNHVVQGSVLRTWLEWLRPGAVCVFSVRTDQWHHHSMEGDKLPAVAHSLEQEGRWRLIEVTEPKPYTPLVTGDGILFSLRTYVVAQHSPRNGRTP